MPGIVTLPSAPNTGLAGLGQVLLASGVDYAQNRRADDREARLRAQRLEDVANDRAYEAQTHTRNRGEHLQDVTEERQYAEGLSERDARLAFAKEMVRTGYLAPGALTDANAVDEAGARFARDGLAARYMEAIKAGDLAYADLGDAQRVAAGLAKFSERLAKHTQFEEGLPARALQAANQNARLHDEIVADANELDRILSEPIPEPTPNQIAQAAYLDAKATKKPGEEPSVAEIQQAAGMAEQRIRERLFAQWKQRHDDAMVRRPLLENRLRDISSRDNTLTSRFGVVGVSEGQPAPVAPPPAPSAPRVDPTLAAQNFAAAIDKRFGGADKNAAAAKPPPPPDPFSSLSDIGVYERPMVQQGRARMFVPEGPQMFDDAANAAQTELDRLTAAPPTRATAGRVKVLRDTLNEIQRRRDQTTTQAAQSRLTDPTSTSTESRSPLSRTSGLQWWEMQPGL